eukprot:TRINITY_DN2318_c0_g2_i1.p1 TRINITY_DN2318_c0_g2~~TRINITY_DN2318_c0_g2_i1.p1  ORF type:complete len:347 (+),score=61.67 TRINITY_DN2318_c0_g2_i1:83-1042(+)
MDSETAKILCGDGNRHYQGGRFWDAVEAYSKAMEIKGEDTHLLSNRSASYLNLRKGDLALSDARRCIEIRPEWSKGYVKAALALRLLGQYGEATILLEKAAEIDPHDQYIKVLEKSGVTDELLHQALPEKQERMSATSSPRHSPSMPAVESYSVPRTQQAPIAVPVVDVVTRQEFSAVRKLCAPSLSNDENAVLYGKDTGIHGHTFTLELVIRGSVNPTTGHVISPSCLSTYLRRSVIDTLDHKHLDTDVPYFRLNVPTTENLASFIWTSLQEVMTPAHRALLHEIRLWSGSTPNNTIVFKGEYRQAPPKPLMAGMEVM